MLRPTVKGLPLGFRFEFKEEGAFQIAGRRAAQAVFSAAHVFTGVLTRRNRRKGNSNTVQRESGKVLRNPVLSAGRSVPGVIAQM